MLTSSDDPATFQTFLKTRGITLPVLSNTTYPVPAGSASAPANRTGARMSLPASDSLFTPPGSDNLAVAGSPLPPLLPRLIAEKDMSDSEISVRAKLRLLTADYNELETAQKALVANYEQMEDELEFTTNETNRLREEVATLERNSEVNQARQVELETELVTAHESYLKKSAQLDKATGQIKSLRKSCHALYKNSKASQSEVKRLEVDNQLLLQDMAGIKLVLHNAQVALTEAHEQSNTNISALTGLNRALEDALEMLDPHSDAVDVSMDSLDVSQDEVIHLLPYQSRHLRLLRYKSTTPSPNDIAKVAYLTAGDIHLPSLTTPPLPAHLVFANTHQLSHLVLLQNLNSNLPKLYHQRRNVYPRRPTHDPDETITLDDLYHAAKPTASHIDWNNLPLPKEPWYYSFPNASVAHIIKYHVEEENAGSIESDGVNLHDLPRPFSTKKFLDDLDKKGIEPLGVTEEWINSSVQLKLPCVGHPQKEDDAPVFTVTDIHYRPLLDSIREVLQGPLFKLLHTTPFSLRYDPTFETESPDIVLDDPATPLNSDGLPTLPSHHEEVFGEIYTSAAMLEAFQAIPQPPPPQSPDDPVESIIMALMIWSDATHLAQFGTASLWPGYTFFGNHPKEFRAKPSSNAGFHQAYFASLPDSIHDEYRQHYGCDMSDKVYTHLKRELFHRIWDLLLSEDFLDAYENGIKITCLDGIVRLVFPRFFIYGADYPEKVLLATIRSMGGRPCPRCFIVKKQIAETGTVNDMKRRQVLRVDDHPRRQTIEDARRAIFENGFAVAGSSIDKMLRQNSWVPVRNAFSKLNTDKTPFNFYDMLVPDLLHEVELGVAKAIITHLIRMLQTFENIGEFDARQEFRQIETFGRSVIRLFGHNVSGMKYAAARNFEDCILPVIDGLFPLHQKLVNQLCFELALWHGYAKLRMHTTTTIGLFQTATTDLLTTIRRFARETVNIKTYELPRRTTSEDQEGPKGSSGSSGTAVCICCSPSSTHQKKGQEKANHQGGGSAGRNSKVSSSTPLLPSATKKATKTLGKRKSTTQEAIAGPSALPPPPTGEPTSTNSKVPTNGLGPSSGSNTDQTMPANSISANSIPENPVSTHSVPVNSVLAIDGQSPALNGDPPIETTNSNLKKAKEAAEKPFNLTTYKLHSLPDYPGSIL
ncbi:hypothetical protein MIND_01144700 [Mycena indigotica]|uniref:Uncharacterized protein n=1 Tax=Mycena indigotica TaxID=2126181 RepID=A0A8H6S7C8_9AGAR|nr:uncharacterized protein MIND_01144700 [Mycena indigotica]KAF7293648.1 hypothetical protein MIND_01144700 [Mycena indigotica]